MTAYEYYNDLEDALTKVNATIATYEAERTDEFSRTNYSEILYRLYKFQAAIERMLAAHRYFRLSKEAFIKKSELKEGKRVEVLHTVKSYESVSSIAKLYNIKVEDLLRKNDLLSGDLVAGTKLNVEIPASQSLNKIYDDIPTYGSQEGLSVLGKDTPNELREDNTGDLYVFSPEKTVAQGIQNRVLTSKGDYPMVVDFGIESVVGGELPGDLEESLFLIKTINQLRQDKRVSSTENMEISRSGNSIKVTGNVITINNKEVVL